MASLSNNQTLYLLYVLAYEDPERKSVTRGKVKSCIPKGDRDRAEETCTSLIEQGFLDEPRPRRLTLSGSGRTALVQNLIGFDSLSSRSPRVTNALLSCLKDAVSHGASAVNGQAVEMSNEDFQGKFKELYLDIRKAQMLRGSNTIYEKELLQAFQDKYHLDVSTLRRKYEDLQETGVISVADGRHDKNIEWVA